MEPPTGEPKKNRTPLLIGAGVAGLLAIAGGLYLETPRDVGKLEPLAVGDASPMGEAKAKALREIGDYEAELRNLPEESAKIGRSMLAGARQDAMRATSPEDLEKVQATLKSARELLFHR